MSDLEVERQAAAALNPDRDRLDRLARERRADVERIAEAVFVAVIGASDFPWLMREETAKGAFAAAEDFVAERDRRREK